MASTIKVDEILDGNGNQFDGSQLGNVGKVLQVKQTILTGTISTTARNFDIMSVSITPKSTSSKVLVQAHVVSSISGTTTMTFTLYRNGSEIQMADSSDPRDRVWFRTGVGSTSWAASSSGMYLDSPSSSSLVTYTLKGDRYALDTRTMHINRSAVDSGTANNNDGSRAVSTITVMEIGE